MIPSQSIYYMVRGVRYHVRQWGSTNAPKVVFLHGWMDVSASFQFVVDQLRGNWQVLAPDWRGFGLTDWSGADSYWQPDYLADLDKLLDILQPDQPVNLVGHSMGGNIACVYAGVRPRRVSRLVNLEGVGMRDSRPTEAPRRLAQWLDELGQMQNLRDYASYDELADRLCAQNARLDPERAAFLARHRGCTDNNGRIKLRGDPTHKRVNPVLYRGAEIAACLRAITAPVAWVEGELTDIFDKFRISREEVNARVREIPNCIERKIPGAGHMVHHEKPECVAEIIDEFLV